MILEANNRYTYNFLMENVISDAGTYGIKEMILSSMEIALIFRYV
jgi:hypothetical protein